MNAGVPATHWRRFVGGMGASARDQQQYVRFIADRQMNSEYNPWQVNEGAEAAGAEMN